MLKMNIKTPQTFKLKIKTHFPNIILANLQEKEIEPTKEEQIVEADFGYDGLKQVNVKPIPSEYIKPTGTKEIIENGIHNVKEFENVDVNVSYTPNYQEKNVTPTKEMQIIIADENYDALEKVNVSSIPDEYIVPSGNLDITENGSYDVKDKESVNVEIASSGGSAEEYFNTTYNGTNSVRWCRDYLVKKVPDLIIPENITNLTYLCAEIGYPPKVICSSKVKNMSYLYSNSMATNIDTSGLDMTSTENLESMYNRCEKLIDVDLSNKNATYIKGTSTMFYNCYSLKNVDLSGCDFGRITAAISMNGISSMFYGCSELENLVFGTNLGKGYTASANNNNAKLDLSSCTKLTYDSLIDVINKLYDLASAGKNTQKLVLGATNLAKLEATEEGQQAIENATIKGWNVS